MGHRQADDPGPDDDITAHFMPPAVWLARESGSPHGVPAVAPKGIVTPNQRTGRRRPKAAFRYAPLAPRRPAFPGDVMKTGSRSSLRAQASLDIRDARRPAFITTAAQPTEHSRRRWAATRPALLFAEVEGRTRNAGDMHAATAPTSAHTGGEMPVTMRNRAKPPGGRAGGDVGL